MTTTPLSANCILCKKPACPTCMIHGRTKFPHLHSRRSDPGLTSSLALPIPECPVCKKSIRVSCLTERHMFPCRSCGLSYASTPLVEPDEAMTWLATLPDGTRAESPRHEPAKIAEAELKKVIKAQPPEAHPCIESITTMQDPYGETIIMGLHVFDEWDRRLDILNVSARENCEGEVASASKALRALKEVREII
ncbi:uncharacterized protein BDV14DRAFT_198370 [Aspergillus stella-maris]|uniref:uncharacterized protein n=1 Tax=Aspergillus stella-maris TaxID=1810926 RepID=UPI003CCE53CB